MNKVANDNSNPTILGHSPVQDRHITVYQLEGHQTDIRPGLVQRDWMDALPQRFGYRCLPLNIANSFGWDILCSSTVGVRNVTRDGKDELEIRHADPNRPSAVSHFGSGILTFHIPVLFRTPKGTALHVSAPANQIRPGAHPLTGVVEADWLNFTFTMNWMITEKDRWVTFEKGEPICTVFPVDLAALEATQIELRDLNDDPECANAYRIAAQSRENFNASLKSGDPAAVKQGWQRDYFQGQDAPNHRTKLSLRQPTRCSKAPASKPNSKDT